jgi:hypothetical protein
LNPLRLLYVGWDGTVWPCINLGIPVDGTLERWWRGQRQVVERPALGHLTETSLRETLDSERYVQWTAPLAQRLEAERSFLASVGDGMGVSALRELDQAHEHRERRLRDTPFPAACRGCPKQWGW